MTGEEEENVIKKNANEDKDGLDWRKKGRSKKEARRKKEVRKDKKGEKGVIRERKGRKRKGIHGCTIGRKRYDREGKEQSNKRRRDERNCGSEVKRRKKEKWRNNEILEEKVSSRISYLCDEFSTGSVSFSNVFSFLLLFEDLFSRRSVLQWKLADYLTKLVYL